MITQHGLVLGLVVTSLGFVCADCSKDEDAPFREAAPVPASVDSKALSGLDEPSPAQSSGLFIGIGEFDHEPSLIYTVNDAVDLAHTLSVEHGLLPLNHVRILLSGNPEGASSERYERIRGDALIGSPTKANILAALREQAALVGPKGVLYIFIASHGYSEGEDTFVMAKDSDPQSSDTAISAQNILDATQTSKGRIVLILDTCRVKVASSPPPTPENREMSTDPSLRSATPSRRLAQALTGHPGYAVLFATGPGRVAGPNVERLNGNFTGAILDGLCCRDASAQQEMVSLFSLASFAQAETRKRSQERQSAELLTAGGFRDFLMVRCGPVCEILEPRNKQVLPLGSGIVIARCYHPGLNATAVLYTERARVFFHQPQTIPASPGEDLHLTVTYGGTGPYQVYLGLSSDPNFLDGQFQVPELPKADRSGRPVYWLTPIHVTVADNVNR